MKVVATVICTFLLVSLLSAQSFRGGIVGIVTDPTGATIADAQVKVTSSGTGLNRTVQSDAEGNFRFSELPVGSYDITVTKSGFNTQTTKGVMVTVSSDTRTDVRLAPGTVQEVVEVEAATPIVDTTGDTVGGTIQAQQLESIPVNGRDYMKVMTLVPGATSDPASVSDSPGSFGIVSVNGNRGRSNNYLLDGTDMNDGYRNDPAINEGGVFGVPSTILPLDALEAVPVISGAEAEYGRNSGGTINIVTKSGTNDLHGSIFEYFRNNALDARNYFNSSGPANSFHNNQFGGSLGGPIWKDHTFFFLSYEGQREKGGISSLGHVPTTSDVNAAIASAGSAASPVILDLLANHYPWPQANVAIDANGNNLLATTTFSNRLDSFIGKIDHH
ncbi:MAG: TonB-dependent receptor, partial [Acidobacteriales bacterium]|nr:TonB-dependent receptor [Terriglobales bacterium]